MQQSESIAGLAAALAKAQAEIENVVKDANNPHFRSGYATLGAVLDTARPCFAKHGLSFVQMLGFEGGIVTVETQLMHASGEWLRSTAGAPAPKQDPQGVGSACSYLRRYSLAALCGIAQTDDDGTAANGKGVPTAIGSQSTGRKEAQPAAQQQSGNGKPWDRPMPFGTTKGTALSDHTPEQLQKTLEWCNKDPERREKFGDLIRDITTTIAAAEGATDESY